MSQQSQFQYVISTKGTDYTESYPSRKVANARALFLARTHKKSFRVDEKAVLLNTASMLSIHAQEGATLTVLTDEQIEALV